MTDFSTSLVEPEAPDLSTQLDAPRISDETIDSKAPPEAKAEKPQRESLSDQIRRVAEEADAKAPKPVVEEKPKDAPAPDAKAPEAKEQAEGEEKPPVEAAPERSRDKNHIEPPAKFLPQSKELWINTPRAVKADVQRVIAEAEAEATQARESVKEFEAVRPYAEMARRGGTTLEAALGAFTRMETTLRDDPTSGIRDLIKNMNMGPVQAIGHILAGHGVTPQQLAEHLMSSPNDYTALARPQQQAQALRQPDPQVMDLQNQLAQVKEQMTTAQVIEPFAAENPRYYELQDDIAFFLQSGRVPANLSPQDRLAAAYDMAVRISPSTSAPKASAPRAEEVSEESRAGEDFGGNKSVRGAPTSGAETANLRKGKLSHRAAIKAAMSELGVAN